MRYACNECEFEGTEADHSKVQDCCSACGENSPSGGPDLCPHCNTANCMGFACPECGARYSPDLDDN